MCFIDADGDGHLSGTETVASEDALCNDAGEAAAGAPEDDCDDGDATVYEGALDLPDDGIDQDCNGEDVVTPVPEGCSTSGGFPSGILSLTALSALFRRRRSDALLQLGTGAAHG